MLRGKIDEPMRDLLTPEMDAWRRGLIRVVLRGATPFGLIAAAVGFSAARPPLGFFYIGLFVAFGVTVLIRPAAYRLQAMACIGLLYGLGILAFYEDGLKGDGRVFMLFIPVLAGLLLGRRAGLVTLGVAFVTMIGFAGAYAAGLLTIPAYDQVIANDPASWASATVVWLVIGTTAALAVNYMLSHLMTTLGQSRSLAQDLEHTRATLERQVAERTQTLAAQTDTLTEQAQTLGEMVETQRRLINTIRQMSTPVVPLQEGVIVMPLVGMIDAERAQQVMQALLAGVETQRARVALLDITGVPVVDEVVANALIQAMRAAQLLGAESILVGLRPEVAQTIVALGVDLSGLTTCGDLQQGLDLAMRREKNPYAKA